MLMTTGLLLLCIHQVYCQNELDLKEYNREQKLHGDLLRDYDIDAKPSDNIIVKVRFILKQFTFDSEETEFSIFSWVFLNWEDARLKWDPKDYDGVSVTDLNTYFIWTPNLNHQNTIEDFSNIYVSTCQVTSSGYVTCVPRVFLRTACSSNLTDWPYDTQSCLFKFGNFVWLGDDKKNHVTYTFNSSKGISMLGAEYGPGWNIIDFEQGEDTKAKTQFFFRFVVERQGEGIAAVILVPSTVLAALTLSSLFLDVDDVRLGLNILSLLGHFYFIQQINEEIPRAGSTMPSVLHFLVGSLIFTTSSIVLTFLLSSLRRKTVTPYQWVVAVNGRVFQGAGRFLIWPRWVNSSLDAGADGSKQAGEVWTDFANIINSFSIVFAIVMYACAFPSLIPRQRPVI